MSCYLSLAASCRVTTLWQVKVSQTSIKAKTAGCFVFPPGSNNDVFEQQTVCLFGWVWVPSDILITAEALHRINPKWC